MTQISQDFEKLYDMEFAQGRQEALENLDREISMIKNQMASTGNARSSSMARAVADAVLARFDKVLLAFERSYISKWADTDKEFLESDSAWLNAKITEKLDPEVQAVNAKCNSALWDATQTFIGFWQKAETEARARRNNMVEKIKILQLKKNLAPSSSRAATVATQPKPSVAANWDLLHPTVFKIARSRFDTGHYADAVEAALKEINDIVRQIVLDKTGKELDGADLMNIAFSAKNPVIVLDDLRTTSGRNIQVGYMQMFAGAMTGIRNPKAHANIDIDPTRALHFLYLASLLLFKIDERRP